MYIYSPTAHTTGPIMTKPDMMMVPDLGMVHTHFSRSRSKVKVIFGAALHKLPHLGMVHAKLGFATILGAREAGTRAHSKVPREARVSLLVLHKVLYWSKKSTKILMDLHALRLTESEKLIFDMSVCLSVCLSVDTITQKIIELAKPNLVCDSYMIKISAGIAYEQNRPTRLASALNAQFVFLVKNALKMCCTKILFRQKLLQITINNFWCKFFFIATRVWSLP